MKKAKNLSVVLYVFVVLSLIYTCYVIFASYSQLSAYVTAGTATMMDVLLSLVSYAFTPLILTVILYALATMNDMFIQTLFKQESNEALKSEENNEDASVQKEQTESIEALSGPEIQEEQVEETVQPEEVDVNEDQIESEEIVDKTESNE